MTTKTYAIVDYYLTDTTALDKAEYSSDNAWTSVSDLDELRENYEIPDYATFSKNHFVLDGSHPILPEYDASQVQIAYWSNYNSNTNRVFNQTKYNPSLWVRFKENHTSTGLTFYFSVLYPKRFKVIWYDLGDEKLSEKEYTPTSAIFFARNQVENYASVYIEVTETHYPNRGVRLQHIAFGEHIIWSDLDVKTAKITEQIDESNASLPYSSAQIEIVDENNDFDIANPRGSWNSAQYYQKMIFREYKNGRTIDCGTFYLNGWSFKSNIAKFKAIDAVGYLDSITWREGTIYSREPAANIIASIMSAAGWTDYTIDAELSGLEITGYLKKQSCRSALKEICFALGAQATCFRSESITIRRPDRYVSAYVGPDRKLNGKTQVSIGDYVQTVSVSLPNYTLRDETSVYKVTNEAGIYQIEFSNPVDTSTIAATGCTASDIHTQYCTITVPEAGECEIRARTYQSTPFTMVREIEDIDPGQGAVTKKYTASVYCPDQIGIVIDNLMAYYQLRKAAQITYLLDTEATGDWIGVTDTDNQTSVALIEQQTIDLTGGFLSTAKCIGYDKVTTANYYTGKELITGDNVII